MDTNLFARRRIVSLAEIDEKTVTHFKKKYGDVQNPKELTKKEKKRMSGIKNYLLRKKVRMPRRASKSIPFVRMDQSSCRQRIAIDLSYFLDDVMKYSDMRMCIKQVKRCYSDNRKLVNPLQLHITGVRGVAQEIIATNIGYKNWDIKLHQEQFSDVFPTDDMVYLTSESENVIQELDAAKVYIIGGLVDHNTLKGVSLKRALTNKVSHGRLPIDEHVRMKKLKVLPINHVFSILAAVASGSSWEEALLATLPQRKDAKPKGSTNAGEV